MIKIEKLSVIKLSAVILALLTALALCSPAWPAAPRDVEFSAEVVETLGGEVVKGKMYMGSGASRYEMDGGREIIVTRRDKKVIWIIFPRLSRYIESEFLGEGQTFIDPTAPAADGVKREFIDYEWVDSYRLRKFLVTVAYPSGGEDKYYEWFRDNFPFPVKTASLDGKTAFEYQKIKMGPQDPSLFSLPKRYKKVESPEEIAELEKTRGKKR